MKLRKIGILVIVAIIATSVLFALNGCKKDDGDSLQRVLDSGEFVVVGSGGYPPFNYTDENSNVVGFDVDVGAEIAERLGVELSYVTSDWDGLVEGLKSKRYDGILGSMAITPDRLAQVSFSEPYYYSGAQLFIQKGSGITSPDDMEGKNIAVATGTNFVQDVANLGAEASLYLDDNATLSELVSGRVDGVITDRLVGLNAINELNASDSIEICGEILRYEVMGIAFHKEDLTLKAEVDKILAEMRADGSLTEISERWFDGQDITAN